MNPQITEWRVVNVGAPRFKYSPFKCFGEDEAAARYFMDHGEFRYSFDTVFHLERRPIGGSKHDWVEVQHTAARAVQQQQQQPVPVDGPEPEPWLRGYQGSE